MPPPPPCLLAPPPLPLPLGASTSCVQLCIAPHICVVGTGSNRPMAVQNACALATQVRLLITWLIDWLIDWLHFQQVERLAQYQPLGPSITMEGRQKSAVSKVHELAFTRKMNVKFEVSIYHNLLNVVTVMLREFEIFYSGNINLIARVYSKMYSSIGFRRQSIKQSID